MFFSKPALLGIDINREAISCLKMQRIKTDIFIEQLVKVAYREAHTLPFEKSGNGFHASKNKSPLATFTLRADIASTGQLCLPRGLTSAQIIEEIKVFMREQSGTKTDFYIDYHEFSSKEPQYLDIRFTAVVTDQVRQYLDVLKTANINVQAIDLDAFALARALHFLLANRVATHAVIHCNHYFLLFIIVTAQKVLCYQRIDGALAHASLYANLNTFKQEFFAKNPNVHINHWWFCGPDSVFANLKDALNLQLIFHLREQNIFSQMQFADHTLQIFFMENLADFLLPLGASLHGGVRC